jgi:hypothetical protein
MAARRSRAVPPTRRSQASQQVTPPEPLMVHIMRILMILIPSDDPPGAEPALRPARVIEAYYLFQASGVGVVLASPAGGSPWTRRENEERGLPDPVAQRFRTDQNAHDAFADTLSLDQVFVDDFQAAFCVGEVASLRQPGSGDRAPSIVTEMLAAGKPVAVIPGTVDLTPTSAGEGLLILGRAKDSPLPAAQALLRLIQAP